MAKNCVIAVVALIAAVTGSSWSASPDQVGIWAGTVKETNLSSGTKTTVKSDLQIQIAADNVTTISINGTALQSVVTVFNPTDAAVLFGDPAPVPPTSNIALAILNFKGTTIKGSWSEITTITGPPSVFVTFTDAKFKLKKQ